MASQVSYKKANGSSTSKEKTAGKKPRTYRRLIFWSIVAFLSIVAIVALVVFLNKSKPDTNLELSGRIEGPESRVSATMPGNVESVAIREGDTVRKGQLLLSLDSQPVIAKWRAAQSGVSLARKAE